MGEGGINVLTDDSRFTGEAEEPPIRFYCDYCGKAIREGCKYYRHDTWRICDDCARRFAWTQFLLTSQREIAMPDHWI